MQLPEDDTTRDPSAVTTYRYLRLALVLLVVLLAAAVLLEWWQTGRTCWQTAISGYYYTPARPALVGVLVAVGVCLVAIRGADAREDVLLNLAGMLAPVVAFVPTPDRGTCSSVPAPLVDAAPEAANAMTALFLAGALGLFMTVVAVSAGRRTGRLGAAHVVATAASVAAYLGGLGWFVLDRSGFLAGAHYTAAVGLFVAFVAVVWLNARRRGRTLRPVRAGAMLGVRTAYAVVAFAMVLVPALMGVVSVAVGGWAHLLLGVETALIGLFAVFWLLQTREQWRVHNDPGQVAEVRRY